MGTTIWGPASEPVSNREAYCSENDLDTVKVQNF